MNDAIKLRDLTQMILDHGRAVQTLRTPVRELKNILQNATSNFEQLQEHIDEGQIFMSNGLAISPTMAAMCVDDFVRTVQFIRGTHAAILESRKRYPDRTVRVLYVGCGPFAALVTPLLSIFPSSELVVSLIDVNKRSLDSARTVIETLGLADSVERFENADASLIDLSGQACPDVILLEILRALLEAEPQVAVSRHLIQQSPDALLVPERINIRLTLVDQSKEFSFEDEVPKRDRVELGSVFSLDRPSISSWHPDERSLLPAATMQLPEYDESRYEPMLFTNIQVFGEHSLADYNSGLSLPKRLASLGRFEPGDIVKFGYMLGKNPHLFAERMVESVV